MHQIKIVGKSFAEKSPLMTPRLSRRRELVGNRSFIDWSWAQACNGEHCFVRTIFYEVAGSIENHFPSESVPLWTVINAEPGAYWINIGRVETKVQQPIIAENRTKSKSKWSCHENPRPLFHSLYCCRIRWKMLSCRRFPLGWKHLTIWSRRCVQTM